MINNLLTLSLPPLHRTASIVIPQHTIYLLRLLRQELYKKARLAPEPWDVAPPLSTVSIFWCYTVMFKFFMWVLGLNQVFMLMQ